jgi:hypothetical protein
MYREELSDKQLIDRLLEHEDEILDEEAVKAFRGMKNKIRLGYPLSSRQREWADNVYVDRDIQRHYNENLVSKGKAPRGRKLETFWWEKEENRPLKPPGR